MKKRKKKRETKRKKNNKRKEKYEKREKRKEKGKRKKDKHLKRENDAIMFLCNRANESESGCEDVMNCACTVNCALPKDYRMTRINTLCNTTWDRRSAFLDWESDHSPYHEGLKQIRVVSRLKPPISNLSSELGTLQPSRHSTSFTDLIKQIKFQNSLVKLNCKFGSFRTTITQSSCN